MDLNDLPKDLNRVSYQTILLKLQEKTDSNSDIVYYIRDLSHLTFLPFSEEVGLFEKLEDAYKEYSDHKLTTYKYYHRYYPECSNIVELGFMPKAVAEEVEKDGEMSKKNFVPLVDSTFFVTWMGDLVCYES